MVSGTGKQQNPSASRLKNPNSSHPPTTPRTAIARVWHLISFFGCLNALMALETSLDGVMNKYMNSRYGGKWAFLTNLCLALSFVYFTLAIIKDFIPAARGIDRLATAVGYLVIPAEGLVSVLYWGMHFFAPGAIVPKEYKIPILFDLSLHLFPAVFLWVDFLVFSPPMTTQNSPATVLTLFTAGYCAFMEYGAKQGVRGFPYPFLDKMTSAQRGAFYAVNIPVIIGLFYLANGIHGAVRGKHAGLESDATSKASRKVQKKVQ